jgi:hypothetical protein
MITRARARPLSRIFAVPLLLGGLSGFGLVAALVGDGAWDIAGWLTLAVPVVVVGWCLARSRGPIQRSREYP